MGDLVLDADYPSRELLKNLGTLAVLAGNYADTEARANVFFAIIGMITDLPQFRKRVRQLEFLYPPLVLMALESGIVAYTIQHDQINVHFAVPKIAEAFVKVMVDMTDAFAKSAFDCYAINLRPLQITCPGVDGSLVRRRRVVPRDMSDPVLVDDRFLIHKDVVIEVDRIVAQPHELADVYPLTRSSPEDPNDARYWTRTSCARLVVFQNPIAPVIEAAGMLPLVPYHSTYTCAPARLHALLKAICPQTIDETLEGLRDPTVPLAVKPILVRICRCLFGIRDELILEVGAMLERGHIVENTLHKEMWDMTTLVRASYCRNANFNVIASGIVSFFSRCEDRDRWLDWALHSKFMYFLLDMCQIKSIEKICDHVSACRVALSKTLRFRIGSWGSRERQQADLLMSMSPCETIADDERAILEELQRLNAAAVATLEDMLRDDKSGEKTGGERGCRTARRDESTANRRRPTPHPAPDPAGAPHAGEETTHRSVVAELTAKWPQFRWSLIGSGVFSNASDVDVVATVHREMSLTLRQAYDLVQEATRFESKGSVDGTHLCTLCSRWNGHPLDVQVMREGGGTESERLTAGAIGLARRIESESDVTIRGSVVLLHRWFVASHLKGHTRCHLPGVAVTCIAVTLAARRRAMSIAFILEMLREAVCRDVACIDFDRWDAEPEPVAAPQRPHVPLSVIVNEKNVASRITTSWTRHLLDALSFALTLTPDRVFVRDVYVAWRRRSMVLCATLRPKTESSTALTLFQSLSKLQGHPLIESYHVGNDGDAESDVVFRCTLRSDASEKYRFKSRDAFETFDGYVVVRSGAREFRLNTSGGRGKPFVAHKASALPVSHMFDAGRNQTIPNAPYLTTDVVAAFSPEHWTVV